MRTNHNNLQEATAPLPHTVFETSHGWMSLTWSDHGLRSLTLPESRKQTILAEVGCRHQYVPPDASPRPIINVMKDLRSYFDGIPIYFIDTPLDLTPGTPFQHRVWRAARRIPYGQTRSYAWLARRIRSPKAARAVGNALGNNPISIIIPCHRVIGTDGSLRGFGSGLPWKRRLLSLESPKRP